MDNTDVKTPRKRGRPATGRKTEAEKRLALATKEANGLPQFGGDPGEKTVDFLRSALALLDTPPVDIMDSVAVKDRTMQYIQHCIDNNRRPGIAQYALYMGINRTTLNNFVYGRSNAIPPDSLAAIKLVYRLVDGNMEQSMENGEINVVAGIFLMRNNLQYTNVDTVEIVPKQPEMQTSNIDDVIAEYAKDDE